MFTDILTSPFRAASAVRHARVFHPDGVLFEAELIRTAPDRRGLPLTSSTVLARLSRGIGLPNGVPDIGGLAVRTPFPDAEGPPWDLLLASSAPGRLGRMAPWPATSWRTANLSSLMPLEYDGRLWWVRARVIEPAVDAMTLESARTAVLAGGIRIVLEQAENFDDYEPLAVLTSTGPVNVDDERYGFDPIVHCPSTVRPRPEWLRGLRSAAYRNSRAGRRAATHIQQ